MERGRHLERSVYRLGEIVSNRRSISFNLIKADGPFVQFYFSQNKLFIK